LVLYGGEVLTWALPGRSHWVVVGVVFVHSGTAPAGAAATMPTTTPAAAAMTPTDGISADMAIDFLKRRRLKGRL
jgi:hypothetical protein